MSEKVASSVDQQQNSSTVITKTCKGSAIKGSSLLSTNEDIRGFLRCNQAIFINDVQYSTHATKPPSSWSVRCVELNCDFNQETIIEAVIRFDWTKPPSKKKKLTVQSQTTEAQLGNIQTMLNAAMNEVKALVPVADINSDSKKKAGRLQQRKQQPVKTDEETDTTDTSNRKPSKPSIKKQVPKADINEEDMLESDLSSQRPPRRLPPLASHNKQQPPPKSKSKPKEAIQQSDNISNTADSTTAPSVAESTTAGAADETTKQKHDKPVGVHVAAQRIKARIQAAALAAEQKAIQEQEKRLDIEARNEEQRRLLQERTLQRIEQRRLIQEKKDEETRLKEAALLEQKQLSAEWTASKEHHDRMESLAKAAAERLRQAEEREAQKQRREDYELRVALRKIKQQYDVSTTYVPAATTTTTTTTNSNKTDNHNKHVNRTDFNDDFAISEHPHHQVHQPRQSLSQPAVPTSSSSATALFISPQPDHYQYQFHSNDEAAAHSPLTIASTNCSKKSLHHHSKANLQPLPPLNPAQIERRIELEGRVQRWLDGATDSEAQQQFTAESSQQQRQRHRAKSNSSSESEAGNDNDNNEYSPPPGDMSISDDMQDSLSAALGRDEDDDNGGMGLYKHSSHAAQRSAQATSNRHQRHAHRNEDDLSDLSSDEGHRREESSQHQQAASSAQKLANTNVVSSAAMKIDSTLPRLMNKASSSQQQTSATNKISSPRSSGQTSSIATKKPRRRMPMPAPLPIAPFQEVTKPVLFISSLR